MYDPQLEKLVDMALEDGVITEKEKDILVKRAKSLGIDLDEFEMYLDSRLASLSNTQNTTTSQKKLGDLFKCPSCGASVPSFTMLCKECGFEFRNVSANSSIKELSEKLEHATKTYSKKIDKESGLSEVEEVCLQILDSFPIPSTKDDLMEFALYLAPKIKNGGISPMDDSLRAKFLERQNDIYISKFKQIILKTKVVCKDDPSFKDSIINLIKSRKIIKNTGYFFWAVVTAILGSVMVLAYSDMYFKIGLDAKPKFLDIRSILLTCVLDVTIMFLGIKYRSKPLNWDE